MRDAEIVVKEYRNRRHMQRGLTSMSKKGYVVAQQSGDFTRNPFTFRWNRRKVVVTFERRPLERV